MRPIPFAFMGGIFDPGLRPLTFWHRGSFPGGGSAWTGVASTGTSGSHLFTEITNYPDAGTGGNILNGFASADFNGTNDRLTGGTSTSRFSTTAGSVCVLFKADTLATDQANPYDAPAIFSSSDGGSNIGISVSASGVRGHAYTVAGVYKISQYVPIIAGKWYVAFLSWDSTNLYFSLMDWAAESISLAGSSVGLGAGPAIRLGVNYNTTVFFDGQIEEVMGEAATWSPFVKSGIVSYMNRRYKRNIQLFIPMDYGTPVSDYNAANVTVSSNRVTQWTDSFNSYHAAPNLTGGGPTWNSGNSLYGGKPTLDYATGNPTEAENLFAPAGLAAAIGASERTVVAVGHNTSTSGFKYLFNHESGERFGVFRAVVSTAMKMNGPSNDVFTTIDMSSPCATGYVFKNTGAGRFTKNGGTVDSLVGLGYATMTGGTISLGCYNTIDDQYVWEGSLARLVFFNSAMSDGNLKACVRHAQGAHGL